MGISFEWPDPHDKEEQDQQKTAPPRRPKRNRRFVAVLLTALAVGAIALASASIFWWRTWPSTDELTRAVELQLETEKSAVSLGNHELFLSLHDDDPAWVAARYRQLTEEPVQLPKVAAVTASGSFLRTVLEWTEGGTDWQRLAFFQWQDGRLVRVASDPDFWGPLEEVETSWGSIRYHTSDRPLLDELDRVVEQTIDGACAQECVAAQLPFTLELAHDAGGGYVDGVVRIPSPRLIGFDASDRPTDAFYGVLQHAVGDFLRPATLRFGVPDALVDQVESAARAFMLERPDIAIDVLPLSILPSDPAEMLAMVDAAILPPTPELITGGQIADLTDFARDDPSFLYDELYKIARDASQWKDRLWSAPQHAEFRLLHSDRAIFEVAVIPPGAYFSTLWESGATAVSGNEADMRAVGGRWLLMDISPHSLFAYAYDLRCLRGADRLCDEAVQVTDLADTLDWYTGLLDSGVMPDVSGMSGGEREFFSINQLSYPRKVTMWLDRLNTYEHNYQLGPVDVTASPGVDGSGITPFSVVGSVMSAQSTRPPRHLALDGLSQSAAAAGRSARNARPRLDCQRDRLLVESTGPSAGAGQISLWAADAVWPSKRTVTSTGGWSMPLLSGRCRRRKRQKRCSTRNGLAGRLETRRDDERPK